MLYTAESMIEMGKATVAARKAICTELQKMVDAIPDAEWTKEAEAEITRIGTDMAVTEADKHEFSHAEVRKIFIEDTAGFRSVLGPKNKAAKKLSPAQVKKVFADTGFDFVCQECGHRFNSKSKCPVCGEELMLRNGHTGVLLF
jgi:rRNA maturation endonuclease Nob1